MATDKDTGRPALTPELAAAHWAMLYNEDESFRAAFDEDPRMAVSQLVGQEVPADVKLVIHRKKYGEIHVTVPADTASLTDDGMSTDELRKVSAAGGVIGGGGKAGDVGGRYRPVYDRDGAPW